MVPEIVVTMLAIIQDRRNFSATFFWLRGFRNRFTFKRCRRQSAVTGWNVSAGEFCAMNRSPMKRPHKSHAEAFDVLERSGEWATEVVAAAVPAAEPNRPAPGTAAATTQATERTSAEDPMMIIYTWHDRKPKGAVHTHCGFPDQIRARYVAGPRSHADETLFWMTDMGWMMGPWEVFGTLLLGATMMLYDGAPDFPGPDRVWKIVCGSQGHCAWHFATLIRALRRHGDEIVHRMTFRRCANSPPQASRGTPTHGCGCLKCRARKTSIINYSGGTEISGGIVMGNVLTPMKRVRFPEPLPGMAADVVDENGKSVRSKVGELVIREPWIGMTRGFWRDRQRYFETYWSRLARYVGARRLGRDR